ncbi:hypothetical protein F1735_06260 [Massilia sp. CCM 8694]|uniref:Lipoprotein n=2 Tax=Massilia genomosp. 1 TaxID=2609280 RepID=A0ABX0MGG8_9BURK|nr:hypothetical protein [Massilia genomosp. 1]
MKAMWARVPVAAALLAALTGAAPALAEEECEGEEFIAPGATLVLKHGSVDQQGRFMGTFEFHNYHLGPAVELAGQFEQMPGQRKMLVVSARDTRIEFKDFTPAWRALARPSAHKASAAGKLVVKARSSVPVKAYLFDQRVVRHSGSAFRLKLYTSNPHGCVVSVPFSVAPARAPVTGFVSARPVAPGK